MIILKSPKGWTGVDVADGKQITGSFRAHQVPVDMSKPEHLDIVEKWLMSYRPQELFNPDGSIQADILSLCPNGNRRISANKITYGGRQYSPLRLPDIKKYFVNTEHKQQDMSVLSGYVAELIKLNPQTFRFFSPDEAKSNRLYAPFTVTKRVWGEELLSTDEDLAAEGRIIDSVLSEHLCEGMLEGYTLTGRHGFFASYEAFARVVDSMLTQHTKWLKLTKDMPWRTPLPCLNLIATSHSWQQDHNGFTHQDPGIAAHLLDKDPTVVRCYYPADANSLLCVFEKCMKDTNKLNLITASKHASIQWRTGEQAMNDVKNGISVWQECKNPDVVLACCGDTPTLECVKAVKILHDKNPELKIRLVNVIDLGTVATNTDIFTHDRPVVFVHHGYVNIIKALVSGHKNPDRFTVLGYREEGAITTGFDMRVLNKIDRYHIANIISPDEEYTQKLREHKAYIAEFGVDPDWI
jgi:xylulose-5-phosphate/fructose-6-phosphate phosphoketolase